MARMYRAGTAFVQIVPSFKGIQRDIAKQLKRDLKSALDDKDAYSGIDRNIRDSFKKGLHEASEDLHRDIQKMSKDIDKEVTKGARVSARNVKKVVERELGGGWHGEQMRKMGRELEKTLGTDTFHNLAKEHEKMRKDIQRDIDVLSSAFTKSGEKDAREVDRAYIRLKKAMDKIRNLEKSGLSKSKQTNVGRAADMLGGDNYQRLVEGLSEDEIKKLNARNRKAEAEVERHAKAQNTIQENANKEARRIDDEERKRRALNDARDAARARERYRSLYETQYQGRKNLADAGMGGTRKQERLNVKRDASLDRYRAQIQGVLNDLGKLNNAQPHVRINTNDALNDLGKLQNAIEAYEHQHARMPIELQGNDEVERELKNLRLFAERILRDIDFDVELDDEEAKAALDAFKMQAETIRDIDVDVDVDVNRANYEKVRQQIEALGRKTESVKIRLNDDGLYDDVLAVDAALASIRDKRIGVDITEREALAQIATIEAAMKTIEDEKVDIKIDYDRSILERFIKTDVPAATAGMRRLNNSIKNANVSMSESTQAFRIFSPIMAAVAFAGAPLVSTLGGVVAGLGGIISFAPGAAAGLSPLLFAFVGLEDAAKKYEKAQEALAVPKKDLTAAQKDALEKWEGEKDALGKATVAWIEYTSELKTRMTEIQKGAREGLFPGLQDSIETIMGKYAKPFTGFLHDSGEQLGNMARIWSNELTTDAASEWFARVGRDTSLYTAAIGEWIRNTLVGFGNLTDAFRPFAREFSDWLINSSRRWEKWTDSLTGSDALLAFLESARNILPRVGDLLKNVGELFVNITFAVEPFTEAILDAVNSALDFINAMDPKVLGAILGAVGGLTGGLMLLSGVMAGIGALSAVLSAISGSLFTQIAFGLGSFVAVSSTALGATTALGSEAGVLGDALIGLGAHLEGAADFTRSLWSFMGDLLDAIEPLVPVLADIVANLMDLTLSLAGGLLDALSWVVGLVGDLTEMFSKLPVGLQETILVIGAGSLAFGKLQGAMTVLTPIAEKVFGALSSGAESLLLYGAYGKEAATGIGAVVAERGAVGALGEGVASVKTGLKGLGKSASEAWAGMSGASKAAVAVVAIAAALTAMNAASEAVNLDPAVSEINDFESAIKGMSKSSSAAKAALDNMFAPEGGEGSLGSWADGGGWLGGQIKDVNDFGSAMDVMADKTGSAGGHMREFRSEIYTLFGLFGDTQWDAVRGQLEGMDEAMASMASTDFESASNGYYNMAKAAAEAGVGQEELNEHFSEYRKELENTAAQLGLTNDKSIDYTRWMMGEVPEAVQKAVEAEGEHAEGLAGVGDETKRAADEAKRLVDATNEMQAAFDDSQDAAANLEEAQEVIQAALKSGETSLDKNTEAGEKNVKALRDIRDNQLKGLEADALRKGSTKGMTEALWDNYASMVDTLQQMGLNKKEARNYARELYGVPDWVKTKADFDNWSANGKVKDTQDKVDKLDKSEAKPDVKAKTADANRDIDGVEKKLNNITKKPWYVKIWTSIKEFFESGNPGSEGPAGAGSAARKYRNRNNYSGNILEHYADGGLRPMESVAQVVAPNTWRVVGDRMDVDEAYIPLNGSKRSWSILQEALARMPRPVQFHDGGIAAFASGAVASAGAAKGAVKDDPTVAGDGTEISEAMAALVAALGENWSMMLADMVAQTNTFYANLLAVTTEQNALVLAAHQANLAATQLAYQVHFTTLQAAVAAHYAVMRSAQASHNAAESSATTSHLSTLSSKNSSWRSSQLAATSSFMADMLSRYQSGNSSIRSHWSSNFSDMSDISTSFRNRERDRLSTFLNSTMMNIITRFGNSAASEWSSIWSGLVRSAKNIFEALPPAVGNILSSTSSKMNTHIVTPYNKVVSDLDLSKKLKLNPFPTQRYRDGGMMRGYSPGRDIHKFYSPTGGLLELSGGEPVLRPEVGQVVGSDWVDSVNAAARNGGIQGVKKFFGQGFGHQAHADGGIMSFAGGGSMPKIQKNTAGLIQLGRLLQGMGVRVSEGPGPFGPISPVHSKNSWHYRHGALDLNTAPGQSAKEMRDFDRIMPLLYKLGWGVIWRAAGHFNHAHVDLGNRSMGSFNRNPSTSGDLWQQLLSMKVGPPTGGGGSVDFVDIQGKMGDWLKDARKSVGSGALPELMMGVGDKVFTELAKAKADKFIETVPGGSLPGGFSDVSAGPIKAMAKAMLEKAGWGGQFGALDWLVSRESGWRPTAQNPSSTAYGLFQFLNSTWGTVGGHKTSDPKKQLEYGLRYIAQRYGDVNGAMAFWKSHHWYKDGTAGMELPGKKSISVPTAADIDLNPEVLFRDGGGNLPTGYNIVHNNLAHEETVLPKTVADVTRTFETLEQITSGGDGGVVIKDSVLKGDAREVAQEISRQQRIDRIGRTVKF